MAAESLPTVLESGILSVFLLGDQAVTRAAARHILVGTKQECDELKTRIAEGADFAELAAKYSQCPSGEQGGALGEFGPGEMVPEFDAAVFKGPVGEVQGPIQTQFGFHLVEVTRRTP